LEPAHDPPGNRSRDLLDANQAPGQLFLDVDPELFIAGHAVHTAGIAETAGAIADADHLPTAGDAVDVDAEDRQADAVAKPPAAGKTRIVHFPDVGQRPVGGTDQGAWIPGDDAVGIAKEENPVKPNDEHDRQSDPPSPVEEGTGQAQQNGQGPE